MKMRRLTPFPRACAAAVVVVGVTLTLASAPADAHRRPQSASPQSTSVLDWNEAAGRAALAACEAPLDDPFHESRTYAMSQLAVHDALNAIERRSTPYAADFRAPEGASVDAAVAAAAHDVLVPGFASLGAPFPPSCGAAGVASVEAFYASALAAVPEGRAKADGLAAGRRAAAVILALRRDDRSDLPLVDPAYPQGTTPGAWRFAPGRDFAFATQWSLVTPFALRAAAQFEARPPLALTSRRYAVDLNEVKAYGGDGVTTPTLRSAWQSEVAHFWWESSPLMWNAIGRTVAGRARLDPWEQARLLALLDMALADGYVAAMENKYRDLFWRPVTAIREAASDGNPATTADPTWTPLEVTPPIPDHPSGHSVEGGAAAGVLRAFFGTDRFSFSACSVTVTPGAGTCGSANPILHHFTSFTQAARENAESRIWIGFHFRYATEQGMAEGLKIGRFTVQHELRPRH